MSLPGIHLLTVLLALTAMGYGSTGPRTIAADRYCTDTIASRWKQQMLMHVVKLRYRDAPVVLNVASLWYWIDDLDRRSKAMFMFSLAESDGREGAPVVTIPAG